jgi:FtsH-binding integral membrane protein
MRPSRAGATIFRDGAANGVAQGEEQATMTTTTLDVPLTHDESATLLGHTMGLVAATAGFFAVGAYLGRDMSYQLGWLWFIAAFACLIAMNVVTQRSEGIAVALLFGFGVVLIFVDIPNGSLIYAVGGLVIFAGLTAFDFQRLRRNQDIRSAPLLAASIFLDALNVFLFFLSIFSGDRD